VENIHGDEAATEADECGEKDESPVMLVFKTVENLKHHFGHSGDSIARPFFAILTVN
jgi:hypothetical protein